MENKSVFRGPIFIVGLSRSGTTLVRELFNGHDQINLPRGESHILPMLVNRFGEHPDFADPGVRNNIVNTIETSMFVELLNRKSMFPDLKPLCRVSPDNWQSFLEKLFRSCAVDQDKTDACWGDKTPGYLAHMQMLKRICPDARFVHIVRDVRDRCISVHGRWGKNRFRAAHQWAAELEKADRFAGELGPDYLEIHYEELIQNPDTVLERVCAFLDLEYQEKMKQLKQPVQIWSDTSDQTVIVSGNTGKYKDRLNRRQLKRIEEIAYPTMVKKGYAPVLADGHKPLGTVTTRLLVLADRLTNVWFLVRRFGMRKGLHQSFQTYVTEFLFGKAKTD